VGSKNGDHLEDIFCRPVARIDCRRSGSAGAEERQCCEEEDDPVAHEEGGHRGHRIPKSALAPVAAAVGTLGG